MSPGGCHPGPAPGGTQESLPSLRLVWEEEEPAGASPSLAAVGPLRICYLFLFSSSRKVFIEFQGIRRATQIYAPKWQRQPLCGGRIQSPLPKSPDLPRLALCPCFTVLLAPWHLASLFLALSFHRINVYEQIKLGLLLWAVGSLLTWGGASDVT